MQTVTILLPVFNSADTLALSLDSLLIQAHKDIKILALYDKSRDGSLRILEEYAGCDSRIEIIHCDGNGLVSALNKGLEISNTAYIARMDSDDICDKYRILQQVDYIEKNNLDIVGCFYTVVNDQQHFLDAKLVPITPEQIFLQCLFAVPFAHGSVLFRRDFILSHKLFYGSSGFHNSEDYALWVDMLICGAKFGNVPSWLYQYTLADTTLSQVNSKSVELDRLLISERCRNVFKNKIGLLLITLDPRQLSSDLRFYYSEAVFWYLFTINFEPLLFLERLRIVSTKHNIVGFYRFLRSLIRIKLH